MKKKCTGIFIGATITIVHKNKKRIDGKIKNLSRNCCGSYIKLTDGKEFRLAK